LEKIITYTTIWLKKGKLMKKLIQNTLGYFDVSINRKSGLEKLRADSADYASVVRHLELLKSIHPEVLSRCVDSLVASKSQLSQDLFVLSELDFKENGYFVEFGATNGINLSNSYLLEKKFFWNGILAEPAQMWHSALKANRTSAIETKCVWKKSGETIVFNETENGELSTIDDFSDSDHHLARRESGKRYNVETISLMDLLEHFDAPQSIDYLSIDTEGSEYEILQDFDFERYQFSVITCEHNYTPVREKIYNLLTCNGYERKFEHLSKWDDWYVKSSK
jgi:FkbM family methyltransferase